VGLLGNTRCTDKVRVKYWKSSNPGVYEMSDKFGAGTTSILIKKVGKYIEYEYQVIAIEEKVIRSTDYNRSPATQFRTSKSTQLWTLVW